MLRSVPMSYCQTYIQTENAFETLLELSKLNCVQFVDINDNVPVHEREFVPEIRRLDKLERRLAFIKKEAIKLNIKIPQLVTEPEPIHPCDMVMFEAMVKKWHREVSDIVKHMHDLNNDAAILNEMIYFLCAVEPLLQQLAKIEAGSFDTAECGRCHVLGGVVETARSRAFHRMMWRVTEGNIYYVQSNYDAGFRDYSTRTVVRKVAFLVMFQGDMLRHRLLKIFYGFNVNRCPNPDSETTRLEISLEVQNHLYDIKEVIKKTEFCHKMVLQAVSKHLQMWIIIVALSKTIYHNMNKMTSDISKNCLIGQFWVPCYKLQQVRCTMSGSLSTRKGNFTCCIVEIETCMTPPTVHRTNDLTHGFQMLIDTYSISKYRELNPGLFALVTLPFLFGVMFPDIGHGILISIFAFWLMYKNKGYKMHKENEIMNILISGRYVILLLGLWSIYAGFIFNEIFSRSMAINIGMWRNTATMSELVNKTVIPLTARSRLNTPYVYGADPIWMTSVNKFNVMNSIKIKTALIIGTFHIMFGLLLNIANHLFFRNHHMIFTQFLPEFLMFSCIFFWLVITIYYKWFHYFEQHPIQGFDSKCAPSLITIFIARFFPVETRHDGACDWDLFSGQIRVVMFLNIIVLLCLLLSTFAAPFCLNSIYRKRRKKCDEIERVESGRVHKKKFKRDRQDHCKVKKTESILKRALYNLEFFLLMIMHFTSYLRLWAISLAHSILAGVLWELILSRPGLRQFSNYYWGAAMLFCFFAFWALCTIFMMILLEGTAAFLHALRLHWIEFMSKFHVDNGCPFVPLSYNNVLFNEGATLEYSCSCIPVKSYRYE